MKRIWDIIDKVGPRVEITQVSEHPKKSTPEGSKFTLRIAAGLILAASATFCIHVSKRGTVLPIQSERKPSESVRQSGPAGADTAHAMSGPKLASAFSALFQPAEDEVDYDSGEYYFG